MKTARTLAALAVASLGGIATAQAAETLTIATVNNSDMIIMQKLAPKWEQQTGNKLNWVVLEENVLRQRITTDIATKGGQFDIITIGAYETPIWGKAGLARAARRPRRRLRLRRHLEPVKNGLSADGKLYAVPFYAESSFTFYRKDLFEAAGLKCPSSRPTTQIAEFAASSPTSRRSSTASACAASPAGARTWPLSARW